MSFHKMLQQLWLLVVMILAAEVTAAQAKPASCPERESCGNLSIPYPFSTRDGCYLDDSFLITCNDSKPFLGKSNVPIQNISLDGQMVIWSWVAYDCYNASGGLVDFFDSSLWLSKFFVSYTRNKFTVVGCDTYAFVNGDLGKKYETGCTALCDQVDDVLNGSCPGIGCCQTSIPRGVLDFNLTVKSYDNHTQVSDFNPCGFAFVVEEGKYNFSSVDLFNLSNVEELPVALDWAIGNKTCQEARKDLNTYACGKNSRCYDSDNSPGYLCNCFEGYQGNPYLPNGCQDGNYTCSCPKGYRGDGDGRKDGYDCVNQSLWIKVSLGMVFICTAPVANVEGSSSPHSDTPAETSNVASASTRRGRGMAKNYSLNKHIEQTHQKPKIVILPGKTIPVGRWSKEFMTEVGIICRSYAPITAANWKKVLGAQREIFYLRIKDKFDIDLQPCNVKRAVNMYLARRFRDHRNKLHSHFKKTCDDGLNPRQHPYRGVSLDDWRVVCTRLETDQFKKLSKKNSENRKKLLVNHCAGSRSFVQHQHDIEEAEGRSMGTIELWKDTHYKENKGWTTPQCEDIYDRMIALQSQPTLEGSEPMSEEEICKRVMGTRPGYVRGLGYGAVAPPSSSSTNNQHINELTRENQELRSEIQQIKQQLDAQVAQVEAQVAEKIQAVEARLMEAMMQRMMQQNRGTPS